MHNLRGVFKFLTSYSVFEKKSHFTGEKSQKTMFFQNKLFFMGSQKIFIFDFFKKFNKSNIFNIIIAQKKSVNKKKQPRKFGAVFSYLSKFS